MPNHVTTIIRSDNAKTLEKLIKRADKGKKENPWDVYFDFNQFIPMPKHKEGIFCAKEASLDEMALYRDNWRDWSIKNWGTKWNAYSVEISNLLEEKFEPKDAEFETYIKFKTAWNSPIPIIEEISRLYPKAKFWIQFADEDIGYNLGEYWIRNGEIVQENKFKGGSREAIMFAKAIT